MLQVYRLLTALLAFTGCIGLIISGEISPVMSITGIGLIPGYYRVLKGFPPAPNWVIGGCSILTLLVFFLDSFFISGDYFISIAHLTITFQAIKSFDLKEPWDHLQVYFMALLQLIVASELIYSITFGLLFILFLVVLVTTIVFSHFVKEGLVIKVNLKKPLIYISLLTMFITVIFFISIPRISGGMWSKRHVKKIKSVGFSERVYLGSYGKFKLDPTVIMRVELDPMIPGPYYWRGMTLDYFDGMSWNSTTMNTRRIVKRIKGEFIVQHSSENLVKQKIMLEPIDSNVIFGLYHISSIKGSFHRLEKDPASSLFISKKVSRRVQYLVKSDMDTYYKLTSVDFANWKKYQDIPENLKDQIKSLTDKILRTEDTRSLSDLQRAHAIERYLRDNYSYSLNIKSPDDNTNPILYFLFQTKKGFCEHYATAMTLMLRSAGIPARVVTGFIGGELNTYGGYIIVRQSNAHSWVEAVVDETWRRFDPTPSVLSKPPSTLALYVDMLKFLWNRYVVAFSLSDQKEIARAVSMPLKIPRIFNLRLHWFSRAVIGSIFLVAVVLIIISLKYLRIKRYVFITEQYLNLRNALKQRGVNIKPSMTPYEVLKETRQLDINKKVHEFIRTYEECRFGKVEIGKDGEIRCQQLIKEIKGQLKK